MAKRLHIVEQSFLNTVKEYNLIESGDIIIVGVSGGPDSTTLLACLNKYKEKLNFEIVVAHINHLIREDSLDDEQYVENLCEEMGIRFFVKRAEIEKLAKENKKSTEDMGRIVRYDFFDEVAKKVNANKIAIAHNMNDNAETMLLNLIRGTGLAGLEGIKPLEYNKYIRPLINCERKNIENYCKINNLNPKIDSTNKENIYKRNIIRNKLIPFMEELNPNIVQTLKRTSNIITENNDFIEEEILKIYKQKATIKDDCISFKLNEFNDLPNNVKKNLVIRAIYNIQGNTFNIEKANIDDVIEMADRSIGNKHIKISKSIITEIKKGKLLINLLH